MFVVVILVGYPDICWCADKGYSSITSSTPASMRAAPNFYSVQSMLNPVQPLANPVRRMANSVRPMGQPYYIPYCSEHCPSLHY